MFKLMKSDTFKTNVVMSIPNDGGTKTESKFRAEFMFKTQSQIDGLFDGQGAADADLIKEVLVGWEGFNDADGQQIPFTDENKNQAIDLPFMRVALVQAYVQSINGVQPRTKN